MKEDKKEGEVKMILKNKDKFKGIWKNDIFINGIKNYHNGNIYNGECKNNLNDGKG